MTDYYVRPTWNDVLPQACEIVGLEWDERSEMWHVVDGMIWRPLIGEALPAYVAELLVTQNVGHLDPEFALEFIDAYMDAMDPDPSSRWQAWAPAKRRILAAMVALGHLTPEQAWEVE